MTLNFQQLALLGLLTASIHWLVARAAVTRWFWSRVPGAAGRLLGCAACSGLWLGLALGYWVRPIDIHALRLHDTARPVLEVLAAGLTAVVLTPVVEAVLLWGLERTAIAPENTVTLSENLAGAPSTYTEFTRNRVSSGDGTSIEGGHPAGPPASPR